MKMSLWIDSHEPRKIKELFKKYGIPNEDVEIKIEKLEYADYVFGSEGNYVGIERKTLNDLINSLYAKGKFNMPRLWQQLWALKEHYRHPLLIIEGDLSYLTFRPKRIQEAIWGLLATLILKFGSVVVLSNVGQTRRLICSIYKQLDKKGKSLPIITEKSLKPKEIRKLMLQTISGIGAELSKRILDKYSDFSELRKLKPKELSSEIKGLSLQKASIILEAIS